ncbi:MAG: M28 family peptidase [Actinomycetota bacterium]|nr:M28 family peptidase [Actinomycetota bacterium]
MGIREDFLKLTVEIGPRGASSPAEARAARYIRERFEERGLDTKTQEFFTIDTYSYLYMFYLFISISCAFLSKWFVLYTAPIAFLNAVLFAIDLETIPVISKVFPHRLSRNVIGEIPDSDGKVSMVVVAHYDSAKAALSFHPKLVKNFRISFSLMIGGIIGVGLLSAVNMALRILEGEANFGLWIAAAALGAFLIVPFVNLAHREIRMDFTPGANDNGSGVVAMLALMDKLSESESRLPGIMFVATGAEEVGTAGMIEFLKKHGSRLKDAKIINLDNLGEGHLCYIKREGMLIGHDSDSVLLWLSEKVIKEKGYPMWRSSYRLLSTDATPALVRGYHAMSIMAFDDEGNLPNWHWGTDTIENIDISNIEIVRGFLWNLATRILS